MDRITPTRRPTDPVAGYQCWRDLTFLHWPIDVDILRPLIPAALEIDTFDGHAWIGLVPFSMERIRPWWSPPIPGISWFLETNVRTYVHRENQDPGVWFFSLEANQRLAVCVARRFWNLPYFRSRLSLKKGDRTIHYRAERLNSPQPHSTVTINTAPQETLRTAAPGSLDHFLVERYILYTVDHQDRLLRGRVHHEPYEFRTPVVETCDDRLVHAATGFQPTEQPHHVAFSPGVDVSVHRIHRV